MAVIINNATCDRCGTCIAVCTPNALLLQSDVLIVDEKLCTDCGTCVKICPFGVLTLYDK